MHVGLALVTASALPEFNDEDYCPLVPAAVLQRRLVQRNNLPVVQWLSQWQGLEPEDASWED